MLKAFIDFDRCLKCEKCIAAEVCPTKAVFKIDSDGPVIVEQSTCYGCGDRVEKCSGKAISIKEEKAFD